MLYIYIKISQMYNKGIATYKKLSIFDTQNNVATQLVFPSFWSNDSNFIYNGQRYTIAPTSVFLTKIIVNKGNIQIGEVDFNWKMEATLKIENLEGMTKMFSFKGGSVFNKNYLLTDFLTNEIFSIMPKWNWSRFNYDYAVNEESGFAEQDNNIDLNLMIIICMYSALLISKKRRRRRNA